MEKINLLYVITKLELGGAQKHVLSLIAYANKAKYNIFLFTAKEGLLLEEVLSFPWLSVKRSHFLERPINPFKDLLAFFEIWYFIRKHKISIVHTHSSKAGSLGRLAAAAAKVKLIIHTVHGWPFNEHQPQSVKRIFILIERFLALFTSRIIVVSEHDRDKGIVSRIGTFEKYYCLRLGIEKEAFALSDRSLKGRLNIGEDAIVIGTVACLKPQKSPEDFVDFALILLRLMARQGKYNLKFLLVGDGILRKRVERLIRQHHLQDTLILTGWRRDIPRLVSIFDIFVLTSLWEGLPVSVLEAMAAAKPVVVTNTGGISEIIKEGENGFMVLPHEMQRMAEKVALLIENGSLRATIGNRAQASLESRFCVSCMAKDILAVYNALIEAKKEELC